MRQQSYCLVTWLLAIIVLISCASGNPLTCNGVDGLCSVKVTDAYFAMVHNAMSAVENGFVVAANHMKDPIIEALDAGYRGLNVDLCNCNGNLQLCHGGDSIGCGIGSVDPLQAFTEISNWIAANPDNVLILSIQVNESADEPIPLNMVQQLLQQVPGGFADRLYDHWPLGSQWPTLGDLIGANQQIMLFYFQGPDGSGEHLDGINYWYDSVVATDFQWESVAELESTIQAGCPMTRGLSSTRDFFLIEAFVTEKGLFGLQFQPSRDASKTINTVEWAGAAITICSEAHGYPPTIFSVDFWAEGNLPTLMEQRNAMLVVGTPTTLPAPITQKPTLQPTMSPTTSVPFITITETPTFEPTSSPSPVPSSTTTIASSSATSFSSTPSLPPTAFSTITSSLSNSSSCQFNTTEGEEITVVDGESLGGYISTRCGDPNDFPCFCNQGLVDCPYCAFTASGGDIFCARHNETIEYSDGPNLLSCDCEIPLDPNESPITSCREIPVDETTATPSPSPSQSEVNETKRPGTSIAALEESSSASSPVSGSWIISLLIFCSTLPFATEWI